MKQAIFILAALLVVSAQGCVTMSKYDELQNKHTALAKETSALHDQNKKLSGELAETKKSRDALKGELDSLRKLSEYYYQRGMEHFSSGSYKSAAEFFETVTQRFPLDPAAATSREKLKEIAAISSENYRKSVRNIDAARDPAVKIDIIDRDIAEHYFDAEDQEKLLARKERYAGELALVEEMNKHILVEDDPTHSMRYYRTTRPTIQETSLEKAFHVEIYIAQQYAGKKRYRLKARYMGDSWISYDSIQLRGENGTALDIVCKYPEKLSKMSDEKIFEWSDNEIDEEKVHRLLKSESVSVRFSGGYKFSFNLNDEQMTAFREIAKKFSMLK